MMDYEAIPDNEIIFFNKGGQAVGEGVVKAIQQAPDSPSTATT